MNFLITHDPSEELLNFKEVHYLFMPNFPWFREQTKKFQKGHVGRKKMIPKTEVIVTTKKAFETIPYAMFDKIID